MDFIDKKTPNREEAYDEWVAIKEETREWAGQDRCPACGHHVGKDAKECSDCGLLLIIDEA